MGSGCTKNDVQEQEGCAHHIKSKKKMKSRNIDTPREGDARGEAGREDVGFLLKEALTQFLIDHINIQFIPDTLEDNLIEFLVDGIYNIVCEYI